MKKIIILPILIITLFVVGQDYTWERYNTSYTGGHQSAGTYRAFVSPNWFLSGIITNPELSGYTGFLTPKLDTRPPVIDTIADVPNDQGKWVQVAWNKCGYDEFYNQVNFYSIWREDADPVGKDYGKSGSQDIYETIENAVKFPKEEWYWLKDGSIWTFINQVPALVYNKYSYNAPTLYDSVAIDQVNYASFKIVFHDPFSYYESVPDSGYSVDNLAPNAPVASAEFLLNHIALEWDQNEAEDFQYFAIYKSVDPFNFPVEPYETTLDTIFADTEIGPSTIYYKITAIDFNGNESEASNKLSVETTLRMDLTVLLEGPFLGSNMSTDLNNQELIPLTQPYNVSPWNYSGIETVNSIPNENIVDWILVELRDATDPSLATPITTKSRQAAFLLNNGHIVDINGISPLAFGEEIDQSLFVVIWHRNHIGILSANQMVLTDGEINYDFSSVETNIYGDPIGYKQLSPGIWGMATGDGNADGAVNSGDKISTWNIQSGTFGYLQGDFNLDGQTNNIDKNDTWLINFGKVSQVPE